MTNGLFLFLYQILIPQLEPLTEKQAHDISNLQQLCAEAEKELTEGMDKLLHVVSEKLTSHSVGDTNSGAVSHSEEMADAVCKLESLINFVTQVHTPRSSLVWLYYKFIVLYGTYTSLMVPMLHQQG